MLRFAEVWNKYAENVIPDLFATESILTGYFNLIIIQKNVIEDL